MKCELYEELFTGWINKELSPDEKGALEQHISGCANCRNELQALQQLWGNMGQIETPEPSANMSLKFYAMLDNYKESVNEKKSLWADIKYHLSSLWQWQPRWPMAYNLIVIVFIAGAGYLFLGKSKSDDQDKQLKALSSQVHELKQTMMLALLENPSASERIRGVSYTSEIKHADKQVIDALLATLNNDPNVNVRLSTLDALTHLAGHPEVREGLIKSIVEQDSPLMQLAIADVMLKLQEKRSVGSFRELLKQKDLDHGVRDKIKQTITQLI
jgi:hypothetical protein